MKNIKDLFKFDKDCLICKYKYDKDACYKAIHDSYFHCPSLSNIYYGKMVEWFPFKQIDDFLTERAWKKETKYAEEMDKKYGDYTLETDDFKFIWGVTSWDDLSGHDASMNTMNDIDIIYDKENKFYILGVEMVYKFDNYASECKYLKACLKAFIA